MAIDTGILGANLTSFVRRPLFQNAWRNVVMSSSQPGVIREKLLSAFSNTGYIKVINTDGEDTDDDLNIDFNGYLTRMYDPLSVLENGALGNPIIFNKYSLQFSEKVNVLSGFNEMEYLVSTGRNPRRASLSGIIIPLKTWETELANLGGQVVKDVAKALFSGQGAQTLTGQINVAEDMFLSPPPDPNILVDLYENSMRAYKSIKSGNTLYVSGPAGLLVKGQMMGLNLEMTGDLSSIIQFSFDLIVSDVITVKNTVVSIPYRKYNVG